MIKRNDLSVRVGGQAGDGSYASGELLAKVLKRTGLWVVTLRDFPSRIRGGHTNYTIRAKDEPVYGRADNIDFLVAFDQDSLDLHLEELAPGGAVIYDTSEGIEIRPELRRGDLHLVGLPMAQMARQELGLLLLRNTIALGILAGLLDLEDIVFLQVIQEQYGKRGAAEANVKAFRLGKEYASREKGSFNNYTIEPQEDKGRLLLLGDEAIAYGALVAGCRFLAAYPITPASEIMEWLAEHLPRYGGAVVQAEDEIAAICMAAGASYAGVRAMTSTSGPGFDLMQEALSMVGMNETPLVVVDVQRPGPSTGLPTKTEQGDLNEAIFGGHGDFPRIVLSPGTVEEAFYLTAEAFNLAERFQCPVILLTEQAVGQTKQTVPRFDLSRVRIDRGKLLTEEELREMEQFRRYQVTEDGVSPRALPGTAGGLFNADSNEHTEESLTTEDLAIRVTQGLKRMRKLEVAQAELPAPRLHGAELADVGFLSFGGTYGPIREAMQELKAKGIPSKFLQLVTLWPFPQAEVQEFVASCGRVFVVEQNMTGQLRGLVERFVGPQEKLAGILRFDGQPFKPMDISQAVLQRIGEEVAA